MFDTVLWNYLVFKAARLAATTTPRPRDLIISTHGRTTRHDDWPLFSLSPSRIIGINRTRVWSRLSRARVYVGCVCAPRNERETVQVQGSTLNFFARFEPGLFIINPRVWTKKNMKKKNAEKIVCVRVYVRFALSAASNSGRFECKSFSVIDLFFFPDEMNEKTFHCINLWLEIDIEYFSFISTGQFYKIFWIRSRDCRVKKLYHINIINKYISTFGLNSIQIYLTKNV